VLWLKLFCFPVYRNWCFFKLFAICYYCLTLDELFAWVLQTNLYDCLSFMWLSTLWSALWWFKNVEIPELALGNSLVFWYGLVSQPHVARTEKFSSVKPVLCPCFHHLCAHRYTAFHCKTTLVVFNCALQKLFGHKMFTHGLLLEPPSLCNPCRIVPTDHRVFQACQSLC
jgi:hypothetical protein